jgi:Nitroreductase family
VLVQASRWGSIISAAWSFMLAARAHGLGTVWTTFFHLRHEREAAELLGIPLDRAMRTVLVPVAYSVGTNFGPPPVRRWTRWSSGTGGRTKIRRHRDGRGGPGQIGAQTSDRRSGWYQATWWLLRRSEHLG